MSKYQMTLREYRDLDAPKPRGFVACSSSIDPSGQIPVDAVLRDWWIKSNGRSYSCTPDEIVTIYTRD